MKPQSRNPEVSHPVGRVGTQDPSVAMARDQTALEDDPTRVRRHLPDDTVCARCGSVVEHQRWTLDPARAELLVAAGTPQVVTCPACRMSDEHLPEGIVTLRGSYWPRHRDMILNQIRHEEEEARQDNPLERILSVREEDGCLVLETTNEKLAQKLGRALEKAHKGDTRYHWSDGNPLVRVDWERND